ncbi:hypothetical protein EAM_1399 [Erwinia amylovora ATCC 49946]|nr:hypothetical protein EAM_1399 [Erwinia amylovora ATCC 49946]
MLSIPLNLQQAKRVTSWSKLLNVYSKNPMLTGRAQVVRCRTKIITDVIRLSAHFPPGINQSCDMARFLKLNSGDKKARLSSFCYFRST